MKKYINYTEFSHHDLGWHKADYEEVKLEKNLLTCDIAPFQIKTIKITL